MELEIYQEFLPNNKTFMILENPSSVQEVVLRALQRLQQSGRQVGDILTWICCFLLYVTVMAKQWSELVALMIPLPHIVMGLQSFHMGMTCLHYDWKARKEMNADGSLFWQR